MIELTLPLDRIVHAIETRAAERGVSMIDATRIAGVRMLTWQRWQRGSHQPRLDLLQRVVFAVEMAPVPRKKPGRKPKKAPTP